MGWYYDDQLKSKEYTIRLYGDGKVNGQYSDEAIATAIYDSNFEFDISNTWNNFEAGNMIENLVNSFKPLAGYAGNLQQTLKEMNEAGKFNGGKTWVTQGINKAMQWAATNDNFSTAINSSLVVQGTRFIYFGSTNVDMGNLMMKYTIMHDPTMEGMSVRQQLAKLMPYCIGDFESPSSDGLLSLIGWQKPPGGFKAGYKNVDSIQEGTLKLEFGTMFYIDNLVLKNMSVSMSRVKVKAWNAIEDEPLYADVSLTFQLGGYVTKNTLKRWSGITNTVS